MVATGRMVQHSLKAIKILKEKGIEVELINATFIKPLDTDLLDRLVRENYNIVSVEDNIRKGGLGSYIGEYLIDSDYKGKFITLGYKDEFVEQGKVDLLYEEYGLDSKGIAESVLKLV